MSEVFSSDLDGLAARVPDAARVAVFKEMQPVAAARALVRRGVRDLHLVTVPTGSLVADLLIGARYWQIDSELRFSGGLGLLAGRRIRNEEDWIDPFVGLKGRMPLGQSRFFIAGGGGIGGFGLGSEFFFEFNANLGYQWTPSIGTAVGYRLFDVDYDDGFLYDVRQQGWQLGLTWAF